MPRKEQIVAELGDCLLPNLVNQALVANDRLKYFMTLLQTAREHAESPQAGMSDLRQERAACGIEDSAFDSVVVRSGKEDESQYVIPQAERIRLWMQQDLERMLAPLQVAEQSEGSESRGVSEFERRLQDLWASMPPFNDDRVTTTQIDQITAARPSGNDSVHLLVMNLHKALNGLQRQIAAESIAGAPAYGLTAADRPWVEAFMRGVNRTRRLKFDHPGLDTTATRSRGMLVLQNDIGTTDAHVLVIHVADQTVTLTYTDVHIQRLLFFQNLLGKFPVRWEDTCSRHSSKLNENFYHLCVGRFNSDDERARAEYLEHLGSRLVFLIDWNRARKRLRKLAPKRICLDVLQWAAENDLGHMAFLRMGGEQLVYEALQLSSREPLQPGRPLSDLIGLERTAEFLRFTMRTTAEGLLTGQSELLIRDQVRAELRHYLDTSHQNLLERAAEHASLIVELACAASTLTMAPTSPMAFPICFERASNGSRTRRDFASAATAAPCWSPFGQALRLPCRA